MHTYRPVQPAHHEPWYSYDTACWYKGTGSRQPQRRQQRIHICGAVVGAKAKAHVGLAGVHLNAVGRQPIHRCLGSRGVGQGKGQGVGADGGVLQRAGQLGEQLVRTGQR